MDVEKRKKLTVVENCRQNHLRICMTLVGKIHIQIYVSTGTCYQFYVICISVNLPHTKKSSKNLTAEEKIKEKSVTGTGEQIIDTACKR